jgi:hypothetical protein
LKVKIRSGWNPKIFIPILNFTVNACKITESSKRNILIRALLSNFKGVTNFKHPQCPYEPKRYEIWNWAVSDRFLPKYLMQSNETFLAIVNFFSKKDLKGEIFRTHILGEV